MPNGNEHKNLWKSNIPNAVILAVGMFAISPAISAGVLAGYAVGNVIEPDLDMPQITRSEAAVFERGKPLGCIWQGIWWSYACIIHHRSWVSHGFFISTAIRFVYAFWWYWFVIPPKLWLDMFMVGMFLGLVISDSVHIFADMFLDSDGMLKKRK